MSDQCTWQHSPLLEFDAEDVAQDAFLTAFRALPTFRLESRFSTWLERIAVNEARMHLRRLRNHRSEPLSEDDAESEEYVPFVLSDWREIPSEALERKEVQQMLRRALQLPETYREVILLRDIHEFSIAETAEMLGLTLEHQDQITESSAAASRPDRSNAAERYDHQPNPIREGT